MCQHTGMCRHKPAQAGFDCASTPRAGRLCAGAATGTASSFAFHPECSFLAVVIVFLGLGQGHSRLRGSVGETVEQGR